MHLSHNSHALKTRQQKGFIKFHQHYRGILGTWISSAALSILMPGSHTCTRFHTLFVCGTKAFVPVSLLIPLRHTTILALFYHSDFNAEVVWK